ncbi:MAG TPA: hypothetical protein VIY51_20120 [Xanthobacteraceae bacterium]
MTLTRLVLILVPGLLIADYEFGNGRLVHAASLQAAALGSELNSAFSQIVRRIAPYR